MGEVAREMDFHIHGIIGLIYEAAMDVDLWPILLQHLCDVLESPLGEVSDIWELTEAKASDGVTETISVSETQQGKAAAFSISQLIRSHFTRAMQLNRDLGKLQHRSALLAQLLERFPLGLVYLSSEGGILQQNPQFDRLLHHDRRLRIKSGRLEFSHKCVEQRWRDALKSVSSGEEASASFLISDFGTSPLSALLLSYSASGDPSVTAASGMLLCLAAPGLLGQVEESDLAAMFQLTRAESRLLAALVNGYSIEEHCHETGLSRHTLRTQMKSLLRKTGTNRQEEVVRQVLNSPALIAGGRHYPDQSGVSEILRDEQRLQQGFRLDDGRWMSFAEYGPEEGRPVLFAHGVDGSRVQTHPDESALYTLGIRMIVPDRPGFGLSDMDEKRSVLSWAGDVKQLLDRLGLEQVSVMGFSAGGIYAMALGRELPERVCHITLVSSVGIFDTVADLNGMIPRDRMILTLGRHMPAILTPFMQLMISSLRKNPQQYFDDMVKNLPPFERHYLRHPALKKMITHAFLDATRNGVRGMVYELMLMSQPWGFSPSEVNVPVRLWHGAKDASVPVAMGRSLAAKLPNCKAYILEDSGHFMIYDRLSDILAAVP